MLRRTIASSSLPVFHHVTASSSAPSRISFFSTSSASFSSSSTTASFSSSSTTSPSSTPSSSVSSSSSAPSRTPSPLLSNHEIVDNELALSEQRRIERQARLEELTALEEILAEQQGRSSTHTPPTTARILLSLARRYSVILAAFLCGAASMTASYALWQDGTRRKKELDVLKLSKDALKANQTELQRTKEREKHDIKKLIQEYAGTKTAIVTTSLPIPQKSGYFSSATAPLTLQTASSPSSTTSLRTVTYHAAQKDLDQLKQLEYTLLKEYA